MCSVNQAKERKRANRHKRQEDKTYMLKLNPGLQYVQSDTVVMPPSNAKEKKIYSPVPADVAIHKERKKKISLR